MEGRVRYSLARLRPVHEARVGAAVRIPDLAGTRGVLMDQAGEAGVALVPRAVGERSEMLLGEGSEADMALHRFRGPGTAFDGVAAATEWVEAGQAELMRTPPGAEERGRINEALKTGIGALDVLAPIGKGQSMLVVGPEGSGKTGLLGSACDAALENGMKAVAVSMDGELEESTSIRSSERGTLVRIPEGAEDAERVGAVFVALAEAESAVELHDEDVAVVIQDLACVHGLWDGMRELKETEGSEGMVEEGGVLMSADVAERRGMVSRILQRAAKMSSGGSVTILAGVKADDSLFQERHGMDDPENVEAAYPSLSNAQKQKLKEALKQRGNDPSPSPPPPSAGGIKEQLSQSEAEELMSLSDGQLVLSRLASDGRVAPRAGHTLSRLGSEAANKALDGLGANTVRFKLMHAEDEAVLSLARSEAEKSRSFADVAKEAICQAPDGRRSFDFLALAVLGLAQGVLTGLGPGECESVVQRALRLAREGGGGEPARTAIEKILRGEDDPVSSEDQACLLRCLRLSLSEHDAR